MSEDSHPLGPVSDLRSRSLTQITVKRVRIALSWVNGEFGAVSGACNHVGVP